VILTSSIIAACGLATAAYGLISSRSEKEGAVEKVRQSASLNTLALKALCAKYKTVPDYVILDFKW